ncbi:MAG: high-affinity branched-chain amino acid ABC transporter permease LivM [Hyphomicrobiales bacterium]|nr:high-affinity branched-chain amino acid ABC transporter permease LivM [Hyphomicrobiales bacterium]
MTQSHNDRSQDFGQALPGIIKRSLFTVAIAAIIFLPTLLLRTQASQATNTLFILYRWEFFAIGCAFILLWRVIYEIRAWQNAHGPRKVSARPQAQENRFAPYVGPVLLIAAILMPFMPFTDRYILDIGILIITYVMLGWGLQIVVGLAGLLDLGYVAFYAVGAYSYALLAEHFGFGFWICLPLAGVFAATWGVILGFPVLRLRGDYLAIVTLAFGEIIRVVLLNWRDFTGGSNGLSNIPRPSFFGIPFSQGPDGFAATFGLEFSSLQRMGFLYFLILALALLTFYISSRLRKLPMGRAWEALREDEIACRSLGLNTINTKLSAFAIGAMFGGFAGSFFAAKQAFISPESFNFMESATILAIVVLGGMSSQLGVVFSSIAMVGGIEALRQLQFLKAIFGNDFDPSSLRLLFFGLAMVIVMLWRPRGFVSSRVPTVFFREKKSVGSSMISQGRG